ncbi:hypothetical protein G3T20_05725 [Bordetella hinzii]|uniref:hypothetical protein n=1 Tax=Bordetella hinzii TaxID=103855 RepID=UPI0013EFD735|nr:hypothetical protein [Bordetella hinzii]QII84243.1 hypothetical protein G3T20_05725 [Bordetella hinzii]
MKTRCALLLVAVTLVGCAAPTLSSRAQRVQVHTQMSTLLESCKKLGPVSASADSAFDRVGIVTQAKNNARDMVADKDGDTLVITNIDRFSEFGKNTAVAQGVALRCY